MNYKEEDFKYSDMNQSTDENIATNYNMMNSPQNNGMELSPYSSLNKIRPGMTFTPGSSGGFGGFSNNKSYIINRVFLPSDTTPQYSLDRNVRENVGTRYGKQPEQFNNYSGFDKNTFDAGFANANNSQINDMREVITEVTDANASSSFVNTKAIAIFIKGSQNNNGGFNRDNFQTYANSDNTQQLQVEIIPTSGYHFVPIIQTGYQRQGYGPGQGYGSRQEYGQENQNSGFFGNLLGSSNSQQGYRNGQGYRPRQGYGQQNQGYGQQNQGYGQQNQGYRNGNQNPGLFGFGNLFGSSNSQQGYRNGGKTKNKAQGKRTIQAQQGKPTFQAQGFGGGKRKTKRKSNKLRKTRRK